MSQAGLLSQQLHPEPWICHPSAKQKKLFTRTKRNLMVLPDKGAHVCPERLLDATACFFNKSRPWVSWCAGDYFLVFANTPTPSQVVAAVHPLPMWGAPYGNLEFVPPICYSILLDAQADRREILLRFQHSYWQFEYQSRFESSMASLSQGVQMTPPPSVICMIFGLSTLQKWQRLQFTVILNSLHTLAYLEKKKGFF